MSLKHGILQDQNRPCIPPLTWAQAPAGEPHHGPAVARLVLRHQGAAAVPLHTGHVTSSTNHSSPGSRDQAPPITAHLGHMTSLHQSQLTWCTAPTLAMNSSSPSSSSWSASSLTSRILLEIYRYLDIQICCKTYSILPLVASKFFLKAARKCPLFPLKKIVNRNGLISINVYF